MNLRTLRTPRTQEPRPQQPQPGGTTTTLAEAAPTVVERGVRVQHGIHGGQFPVAGLRVRDARQTLARLLNIDPQAVAVINGRVVAEDEVIGDEVTLLSFVKPSAVKGAGQSRHN